MVKYELVIPDEIIINKIYYIRKQKIMVDRDLASLFGVTTKHLKQAVKRNLPRFPVDFMFAMKKDEFENWRSHFVTSNSDKMGLRYMPFCFTEQGVTMLSCVLSSPRAIQVNIRVIRIFSKLREILISNTDILLKIEQLEKKVDGQDHEIKLIFSALKQLIMPPSKPRRKVGYRFIGDDDSLVSEPKTNLQSQSRRKQPKPGH